MVSLHIVLITFTSLCTINIAFKFLSPKKNLYVLSNRILHSPISPISKPSLSLSVCNTPNFIESDNSNRDSKNTLLVKEILDSIITQSKIIWNFTRPHTIVGSCISIICLYLYAIPPQYWKQQIFIQSLFSSLVPSLFMNLYITGLNQVTDIEIDKINKPYLPIASGELSKTNGIIVVVLSLMFSLFCIKNALWPLQCTVIGSAILGTMYSLPPFRLKRFPLLAAFCILVVRGSLVNLGFFLQAKLTILQSSSIISTTIAKLPKLSSLWTNICSSINIYPEGKVLNIYFAIFGLVIALMKDVPDIRGDVIYKIPSFSVKLGAKKMFRIAYRMLYLLLGLSSVLSFLSTIRNIRNIPFLSTYILQNTSIVFANTSIVMRIIISTILGIMAYDVKSRAQKVEAENPDKVFSFYMHIWNIFYTCYLLLPLMQY